MPQPRKMELRLVLLSETRHFSTEPSQSCAFCAVILHEKYFPKLYRLLKNENITASILLIQLTK